MITEVGGKEKVLSNASAACIILAKEQREVIAERKGKLNISEFVREAIMACDIDTKDKAKVEIEKLKKKNEFLRGELKAYKQKETVQTKIRTETLADLGVAYAHYLEQTNPREHYRNNWIDGRCKSAGISPIDFLAYIEDREIQK